MALAMPLNPALPLNDAINLFIAPHGLKEPLNELTAFRETLIKEQGPHHSSPIPLPPYPATAYRSHAFP